MRFGDLREMSYEAFLERAPRDAFWFFLHIPKTAGSSFSTELATRLRPYRNIHVDYSRHDLSHNEKLDLAVSEFVGHPRRDRFRSASGHVPLHRLQPVREAIPKTRIVTILRAPEARVISDYRYQRTPMHPGHESFKKTFPTLESYVESEVSHDKMAHFVGGGDDVDVETLLRRADEDFAFIGLLEMYPMSFNIIFSLMGIDGKAPAEHKRRTPDTPETRVEMTPELAARIEALNATDMALYRHVRRRLVKHRDAWKAVRRERAVAARRAAAKRAAAPAEAGSGAEVAPGDFL